FLYFEQGGSHQRSSASVCAICFFRFCEESVERLTGVNSRSEFGVARLVVGSDFILGKFDTLGEFSQSLANVVAVVSCIADYIDGIKPYPGRVVREFLD